MNKSAIIAGTQGDLKYIDEWIQYHHNLGFDFILIGFNGNSETFNQMPKYDYVRYIDFSYDRNNPLYQQFYRKNKGFSSIEYFKPTQNLNFMCRCFNLLLDYIKLFYYDVQYVACIDIDEFIILPERDNINVFLKKNFDDKFSSMQIFEKVMTDNGHIYYEDKPVMERFTEFSRNKQISIWRSKFYNYKSIINMFHYDIQANMKIISSPHNLSLAEEKIFNPNMCYIKHFYTKSLEEYISKYSSKFDNDYYRRFGNQMLYTYFYFNEYNDEKLLIWDELCKKYEVNFSIYDQIKPHPYFLYITRYCELHYDTVDYQKLVQNYNERYKYIADSWLT